jgi:hypothetical protein
MLVRVAVFLLLFLLGGTIVSVAVAHPPGGRNMDKWFGGGA